MTSHYPIDSMQLIVDILVAKNVCFINYGSLEIDL